jgi:RNA polymerase sigma factor (sigma-70 family)
MKSLVNHTPDAAFAAGVSGTYPSGDQKRDPSAAAQRDAFPMDTGRRDALYAEFGTLVRKLIGRYGDDTDLRQDLEGEIYHMFCNLVDVYEPKREVPLRPYLVRQLTASTYTYARRRWRERKREVHYDDVPIWISADLRYDPTRDWDDKLAAQEFRDMLPTALATLPDRQKSVVIWRYFDEMSFDQIADNLGVRPATARSLLRHGLNHLRRAMKQR